MMNWFPVFVFGTASVYVSREIRGDQWRGSASSGVFSWEKHGLWQSHWTFQQSCKLLLPRAASEVRSSRIRTVRACRGVPIVSSNARDIWSVFKGGLAPQFVMFCSVAMQASTHAVLWVTWTRNSYSVRNLTENVRLACWVIGWLTLVEWYSCQGLKSKWGTQLVILGMEVKSVPL